MRILPLKQILKISKEWAGHAGQEQNISPGQICQVSRDFLGLKCFPNWWNGSTKWWTQPENIDWSVKIWSKHSDQGSWVILICIDVSDVYLSIEWVIMITYFWLSAKKDIVFFIEVEHIFFSPVWFVWSIFAANPRNSAFPILLFSKPSFKPSFGMRCQVDHVI